MDTPIAQAPKPEHTFQEPTSVTLLRGARGGLFVFLLIQQTFWDTERLMAASMLALALFVIGSITAKSGSAKGNWGACITLGLVMGTMVYKMVAADA